MSYGRRRQQVGEVSILLASPSTRDVKVGAPCVQISEHVKKLSGGKNDTQFDLFS